MLKQNFVEKLILDSVRMRSFCLFSKLHEKYFQNRHNVRLKWKNYLLKILTKYRILYTKCKKLMKISKLLWYFLFFPLKKVSEKYNFFANDYKFNKSHGSGINLCLSTISWTTIFLDDILLHWFLWGPMILSCQLVLQSLFIRIMKSSKIL